jgi:hypothetical protein
MDYQRPLLKTLTVRINEKGIFLYSSQILSFNKMLGQLTDAENTTTLARYLLLMDQAGLLAGLNKYSTKPVMEKLSIPKLQIYNTALISALRPELFDAAGGVAPGGGVAGGGKPPARG